MGKVTLSSTQMHTKLNINSFVSWPTLALAPSLMAGNWNTRKTPWKSLAWIWALLLPLTYMIHVHFLMSVFVCMCFSKPLQLAVCICVLLQLWIIILLLSFLPIAVSSFTNMIVCYTHFSMYMYYRYVIQSTCMCLFMNIYMSDITASPIYIV